MKVALISDVHGNFESLTAVLADADARGAGAVWCMGDSVGYGPDPSAVLAELRRREALMVAGNHDLAACGRMGVDDFNPVAAEAALWTRNVLTNEEQAFLADLPLTIVAGAGADGAADTCTLVHGTLRNPEWEYLLEPGQAIDQFARQDTLYSIVGHTHVPMVVHERGGRPDMRRLLTGEVIGLGEERLILNPGGAGQPRDGDPRAPYMLYDEEAATIAFHRVPYDIAETQRKIRAAGLPEWLALRLESGR